MSETIEDPMKYIWEKVSTISPDGRRLIKYQNRASLEYLYQTGFVDTDRFTMPQWIDAFNDSLQPDGSYLLSETQWMAKRKYRYDGPVDEPFDPMTIREGEWEPDEFDRLLKEKIFPATSVEEGLFRKTLQGPGSKVFLKGKVVVNKDLKTALKHVLELRPSPRHSRELRFAQLKNKSKGVTPAAVSPPTPVQAQREASRFAMGVSESKQALDQLSKLLGKR